MGDPPSHSDLESHDGGSHASQDRLDRLAASGRTVEKAGTGIDGGPGSGYVYVVEVNPRGWERTRGCRYFFCDFGVGNSLVGTRALFCTKDPECDAAVGERRRPGSMAQLFA